MKKTIDYIMNQEMSEEAKNIYTLLYVIKEEYNTLLSLYYSTDNEEFKKLIESKLEEYSKLVEIAGGLND